MKIKILNLLLVISSLFGYLEWGSGNHSFLFESEYEIFGKLFTDPKSVVHPFTIIPILGQILLLITLFQKNPGKILTYLGIACLGILLGFMLFVGILSMNLKILLSTLPFNCLAIITIITLRTQNKHH